VLKGRSLTTPSRVLSLAHARDADLRFELGAAHARCGRAHNAWMWRICTGGRGMIRSGEAAGRRAARLLLGRRAPAVFIDAKRRRFAHASSSTLLEFRRGGVGPISTLPLVLQESVYVGVGSVPGRGGGKLTGAIPSPQAAAAQTRGVAKVEGSCPVVAQGEAALRSFGLRHAAHLDRVATSRAALIAG